MDPTMHFGEIKKSFYKQVFFFCIAVSVVHGQIQMEFYVDGNNIRETGFRHYTTWGNDNGGRYVVCSTYTSVQLKIAIYQHNAKVSGENCTDVYTNLNEYTTSTAPEGIYTCRIEAVAVSNDGHKLIYNLASKLHLTRSSSGSSFCATNKGQSGFIGEEIVMICSGNNRWKDKEDNYYGRELDVFLSREVVNEYICVNRNNGNEVCNLTNFTVLPSLTVQIMPTSFTSDSEVLNFTCTSSPPRLLYWSVLGSNGDILDLDQHGASLKVDTNIDIEQSVGKTTLLISEEVPGENEIYAVICFTYQTNTKAAGASLVPLNKTSRLVTDSPKVTEERSTMTNFVNDGKDEEAIKQSSNVPVVFIVSTVILTVIIIVLIFCWLGSHFLAKQKAANRSKMDSKVETPEATLYDNPAYGSNNEYLADKSDANVDKEYTYIDH